MLVWVPGHAGIKGNERADELAKIAAADPSQDTDVPYTVNLWKNEMKRWLTLMHKCSWNGLDTASTSKCYFSIDV